VLPAGARFKRVTIFQSAFIPFFISVNLRELFHSLAGVRFKRVTIFQSAFIPVFYQRKSARTFLFFIFPFALFKEIVNFTPSII
jgi:hypothetical protein